ncbi:hypothetical protein OROGR_029827 [Orobanche gracilis]
MVMFRVVALRGRPQHFFVTDPQWSNYIVVSFQDNIWANTQEVDMDNIQHGYPAYASTPVFHNKLIRIPFDMNTRPNAEGLDSHKIGQDDLNARSRNDQSSQLGPKSLSHPV